MLHNYISTYIIIMIEILQMLINKYDYLLDNSIESILEYKNTRFSGINTNV